MSVSTHVYSAVLLGSTNRALSIRGGTVSLDDKRAPHVEATLLLAMPVDATLTALDPRMSPPPRVQISVNATLESGTQSRTFNLTLRDRDVDHAAGTVSLSLASDEALLIDYATAADDTTPLTMQNSLRSILNYVLGKAIPGASFPAFSDVAVPALVDSENLIRNPRYVGNWDWQTEQTTGNLTISQYSSGGPSYAPGYAFIQAVGAVTGGNHYITETQTSASGETNYVLSVDTRSAAGIPLRIDAVIYDDAGNIIGFAPGVDVAGTGQWQRRSISFRTPSTTARLRPRVIAVGTLADTKGFDVTAWRLSRDTGNPYDTGYFDGATADTATYAYSWGSQSDASASRRVALQDAATPDALTWKAGQPALDFLLPLAQRFGRRIVCNEQRQWSVRAEGYVAPGSMTIRHAVNLIDGTDKISRSDDSWYDAAVTRYIWRDPQGQERTADDIYAPAGYSRVRLFEKRTPYPGPGFSQYMVRRAQGRGREVSAVAVADWRAQAEQDTTIILNGAPTQTGQASRVEYDLDTDRMTITTRTIDTPASAWIILPTTQRWIDSPTGASWTGEAI
ncbi:hypothetical protein QE392_001397 [Microbacterium proteolyticum]|uniref:hypothetical protein n=1 Tax=Microbacterium proteolyticum TaxID=1572644 RepID=UPI00278309F5|nr:hypothetical protein [Microbacterium proteolyticum]MDQ1169593.1 hypothetical protein [Microbacterium proteolyticum]